MIVPHNAHVAYLICKLMDHGLIWEDIERSMRGMVGADWRDVPVSTWHKRLYDNGCLSRYDPDLFFDDLEILIHGRNKLDNIT